MASPLCSLLADEGLAVLDADLTPWVSNVAGGSSFATAMELIQGLKRFGGVSKESVDALAKAKVHGLIDGAYTDDTGLAQAVATGANEVVLLLDSNSTVSPLHVEQLCKDGSAPTIPDGLQTVVFETPASTVKSLWKEFQTLSLQNASFLTNIAVGSFNLTTADNSYYGIARGRSIQVHVVQLCADVTIGDFENMLDYNKYVQEVVQTLVAEENAALVKSTLLPMFTGTAGAVLV